MSDKPLSDLVRQGWTIAGYSASDMNGETYQHNILLTRQGAHRILTVRKKMMGEGLVASELDV